MKTVIIFDASTFMYRSFFGKPEDPLSGLTYLIDRVFEFHKPDEAIAAFDHGKETFRNKLYSGYKGARRETPPEYTALQPSMRDCFASRGLKILSVKGYESDDIIGTLCKSDTYLEYQRVILSRDKDLMQLIGEGVCMCNDGAFVYTDDVIAKFGVGPALVTDVLGLQGDRTDNIPGVAGVGAKTASKLVQDFGALENLFENLPQVQPDRVRMLLQQGKEAAFLSRELATIKTDVPLD